MAAVVLRSLSKTFRPPRGGEIRAVREVSMSIESGEFLVVVGPSGSGKTTILRLISGLEEPTAGEVLIGGRSMARVPPHERGVAVVFQEQPLFPHRSVRGNLELGLQLRRIEPSEILRRVDEMSRLMGLGDLLDRQPGGLSGGERQRVALGMALMKNPAVLLLDEPLAQLDPPARNHLRTELKRVHAQIRTTTLLITHDQAEAMALGDRLAVLRNGEVQQIASPRQIYREPANAFVAEFFGSPPMNFVKGRWTHRDGRALFRSARASENGQGFCFPLPKSQPERNVLLGVRPEAIRIDRNAERNAESCTAYSMSGWIEAIEDLGSEFRVRVQVASESLTARVSPTDSCPPGEKVEVQLSPETLYWFDAETGRRLEV